MTIIWGGIDFEGPYPVRDWTPPEKPAIYLIMTEPDPKNKPHMYESIYFGESANLDEKEFWRSHEKYECFLKKAESESNLYIGFHALPESTEKHRREIMFKLIERYVPACNNSETKART
ncbi:MAG: hypothetical protein ACE5OO_01570 [Candidatus Bathyarchaeia archaeon]